MATEHEDLYLTRKKPSNDGYGTTLHFRQGNPVAITASDIANQLIRKGTERASKNIVILLDCRHNSLHQSTVDMRLPLVYISLLLI
jgi:hypothetical protein